MSTKKEIVQRQTGTMASAVKENSPSAPGPINAVRKGKAPSWDSGYRVDDHFSRVALHQEISK